MELLALVSVVSLIAGGVCGRLAAGWRPASAAAPPPPPPVRQVGADPPPAAWLDGVTRRRMLVHTRDGQTIDGQLVRVDRDGLVLSPASLVDGPHDLDGEVWVPRERVAWAQKPTGQQ